MNSHLTKSELGKKSEYTDQYEPNLLFAIPRKDKRQEIGIDSTLPFVGVDIWNHFEVSWLNLKGKPQVAIAEITIPCDSPNIIESKSMKLYFNSFNNTKVANIDELTSLIQQDLSAKTQSQTTVKIFTLSFLQDNSMQGICLDDLDIQCSIYNVHKEYLTTTKNIVTETLYSNLLKSNCLVTKQPDWGSIQIDYQGKQINHEGLLKYIISYRNHNEFHEQCIERIFLDILQICQPNKLSIYGRFTRRGGLDINVYRSTENNKPVKNQRTIRQ